MVRCVSKVRKYLSILFLSYSIVLLTSECACAQEKFIRITKKEGVTISLDTSITRYVPQEIRENQLFVIDLVSAIHVADKNYYQELNKTFKEYDVVLYEVIAPHGSRPQKSDHLVSDPITAFQLAQLAINEVAQFLCEAPHLVLLLYYQVAYCRA